MALGIGGAGTIITAVGNVIDELFDSPEEKRAAQLALFKAGQAVDLAQIAANTAEAQSGGTFKGGWRPFIGWVCGMAFAWKFLLLPLINTGAFYAFVFAGIDIDLSGLPVIKTTEMLPILGGMLGLGAYRSFDKTRGAAK